MASSIVELVRQAVVVVNDIHATLEATVLPATGTYNDMQLRGAMYILEGKHPARLLRDYRGGCVRLQRHREERARALGKAQLL